MKALRKEIIIKLTRIENQKCSINSKQAKYLYLTTKFFKWLSKRNETNRYYLIVLFEGAGLFGNRCRNSLITAG